MRFEFDHMTIEGFYPEGSVVTFGASCLVEVAQLVDIHLGGAKCDVREMRINNSTFSEFPPEGFIVTPYIHSYVEVKLREPGKVRATFVYRVVDRGICGQSIYGGTSACARPGGHRGDCSDIPRISDK